MNEDDKEAETKGGGHWKAVDFFTSIRLLALKNQLLSHSALHPHGGR